MSMKCVSTARTKPTNLASDRLELLGDLGHLAKALADDLKRRIVRAVGSFYNWGKKNVLNFFSQTGIAKKCMRECASVRLCVRVCECECECVCV